MYVLKEEKTFEGTNGYMIAMGKMKDIGEMGDSAIWHITSGSKVA